MNKKTENEKDVRHFAQPDTYETMLETSTRFYYFVNNDLLVRQDNLFKAYLWVASLIVTLNILFTKEILGTIGNISGLICTASITVSAFCMLICLDGMRGRIDLAFPQACDYLKFYKDYQREVIELMFIEHLWDNINQEIEIQSSRGRKLRATSISLIISLSLLCLSVIVLLFTKLL
jgi:hypothetical protein